MTGPKALIDLARLPEDSRIALIAERVTFGEVVGVLVERGGADAGKADRYIEKMTTRYPHVVLLRRTNGPTMGVITLTFGLRKHQML